MTIKIYSLNTLHIVHEINYNSSSSFILNKYRNEQDRINDICTKIKSLLLDDFLIICLQEVSGDLLVELLKICKLMNNNLTIYYYKIPRIPKCKYNIYNNNNEYLVTMVYDNLEKNNFYTEFIQYPDPGKSALIIFINKLDICCINTHLPINNYNDQYYLEFLKYYINNYKNCLIIGDWNKSRFNIIQDLKKYNIYDKLSNCSIVKNYTYKKLNNDKYFYRIIDHVFLFNSNFSIDNSKTKTFDDEISDHSLLLTELII